MDDKKTKVTIAIVVVIILIIIAIIFSNKSSHKNENNNNTNMNGSIEQEDKVSEIKKIDGYEIFNAQISVTKGITNFKAYIRNKSNTIQKNKEFKIEILDSNEQVLGEMSVHIEKIEPNEIIPLSTNLMKGLKDIKDYRVIEQ